MNSENAAHLDLRTLKLISRRAACGLLTGSTLYFAGSHRVAAAPEIPAISTSTPSTKDMKEEITNVLKNYEKALNTSDAKLALSLYGSEPIVMPQGAPAMIGREGVQTAYEGFFKNLRLHVAFQIHEIVGMGGDLAYVRTTSAGTQEILAGHQMSKEANNELFIFRQEDGHWKIHRYLFATSNPPS